RAGGAIRRPFLMRPECWRAGPALMEDAVRYVGDVAVVQVYQQQVGSIAHPAVTVRRRAEPEVIPIIVVIMAGQENPRENPADRPAPIMIAVRVMEDRNVDR